MWRGLNAPRVRVAPGVLIAAAGECACTRAKTKALHWRAGFTLRRRNDWVRGRCDQSPHEFRHATVVLRPFGNRFPADDRGTDCGERVTERLQPATTAVRCGHRGCNRDDLPFELTRANHPV